MLTDEAKTNRLMLNDIPLNKLPLRNTKRTRAAIAIAGGRGLTGCIDRYIHTESKASDFITSQTVSNEMEYLIVISVAEIMIAYVWIIGRCLRNA